MGVLVAPQRQQLTRLEAPGSSKPKKLRARGRKMKPRRARAAAAAAIKAEPEEEEEARHLRTSAPHQPRTRLLRAHNRTQMTSLRADFSAPHAIQEEEEPAKPAPKPPTKRVGFVL